MGETWSGNRVSIDTTKCLIYNCTRKPQHRNYCLSHYRQLLRAGEFTPWRPSQMKPVPPCEECKKKPSLWRNLCVTCYHRRYREEHPEVNQKPRDRYKTDEAFRQAAIDRAGRWQRENRDKLNAARREKRKRKREAQKA